MSDTYSNILKITPETVLDYQQLTTTIEFDQMNSDKD